MMLNLPNRNGAIFMSILFIGLAILAIALCLIAK
jgi:hypothetical protein